jgi:hypothetical protein
VTGRRRGRGRKRDAPRTTGGTTDGAAYDAEALARFFHETYERLAPSFDYVTRPETAVPWEQVPGPNKRLMIAVCAEILARLRAVDDG